MNYSVDELADATGIAVDTIRYYQRQKLLSPPRREGRRAIYAESHVERLTQIRELATEGFTLAQIRALGDRSGPAPLAVLAQTGPEVATITKSQLAEQANVPEFIVDVVVSAGLLTPTIDEGENRFTTDAVEMLGAARTLVSEGVSLESLTALAMRHATHVETVIDDAIDLVKGRRERDGEADDAELRALIDRLVPAASQLVAKHFERTLRTRALARFDETVDDAPRVVVLSRRLEHTIDPVAVYSASTDELRTLWVRPDEGFSIVALGAAARMEPHGPDRFAAASAARVALAARLARHGPSDAPAPVLVGGFAFASGDSEHRPDWTGYGDARWVLPEVTVLNQSGTSWLVAAAALSEDDDETGVLDLLEARLEEMASTQAVTVAPPVDIVRGAADSDDPHYRALVADAIRHIGAGSFDKVVLARSIVREPADTALVLRSLTERFPTCATFAFGVGERMFLGASPEPLVTLHGDQLTTVALAGTTGTDDDPAVDQALAETMAASAKIQAEHRFVVDDIIGRLNSLGLNATASATPEVMRLARVQHLMTPVTATVNRRKGEVSDMDVLRAANVLHPSPAVGGTPTDAALAWIAANENFDRGWYAAPVGWCDLDGDGELRVALRSALVDPHQIELFAGAGIVTDSDPAEELEETAVKLRALLDVMESTL